ncbi:MAG: hypothetical protein ACPGVK_05900 [Halocynthiibacter sp.]
MTAITEFERLEATGLWRRNEAEQRQNVIVSLGNTSLIVMDNNENPLSHWALPALRRLNAGVRPALFAPGVGAEEQLEIEDDTMIDALEELRSRIDRVRPHPGRLRAALTLSGVAGFLAISIFWVPTALTNYTARIVPDAQKNVLSARLISRMSRISGPPCLPRGSATALANFSTRIFGTQAQLIVVPDSPKPTLSLPNNAILMSKTLFEDFDDPAVAAGYLIVEKEHQPEHPSLRPMLRHLGLKTSIRMLTTGEISDADLDRYAEHIFLAPAKEIDIDRSINGFSKAGIPSTPYAYAVDVTGEKTLSFIEADPLSGLNSTEILPDQDWVSLQDICSG